MVEDEHFYRSKNKANFPVHLFETYRRLTKDWQKS